MSGVGGEEGGELVVREGHGGRGAGADVGVVLVVVAPHVDAGRDVGEDPGLLVKAAELFELGVEPRELGLLTGLGGGAIGWG